MRYGTELRIFPVLLLLLAGCAHEREFRVAHVGSEGSVELAGDEASSDGRQAASGIVASGNILLGPAGRSAARGVSSGRPAINGTVTSVLTSTNQTLVQMTDGTLVLLNGVGGTLGDVVAIDPAVGRIVGSSGSLVGLNATGPGGAAALSNIPVAGVIATQAGNLVNLDSSSGTKAVTGVTSPVRSTTGTVTNILRTPLGGSCC